MQRPRIGIPLCLDERGRWREGRDYLYIDDRYARSIEAAGGLPIQLPIQSDAAALAATIDGLLLPGGDDFPSCLLYTSPSPRDATLSRMPSSA